MPSYQLAIALPVLARAAREWGPWPELDALVDDLAHTAQRRGMQSILARVERQARGEEMLVSSRADAPAQENGRPLERPSQPADGGQS